MTVRADPGDARAKLVSITPAGAAALPFLRDLRAWLDIDRDVPR